MQIDVIALARKAGGIASVEKYRQGETDYRFSVEPLERFAQLVQQATAEQCIDIADRGFRFAHDGDQIADAIRAKFATKAPDAMPKLPS